MLYAPLASDGCDLPNAISTTLPSAVQRMDVISLVLYASLARDGCDLSSAISTTFPSVMCTTLNRGS